MKTTLTLLLIFICTFISKAQWNNSTLLNTAVSNSLADQTEQQSVSDGAGGVIITWLGDVNGNDGVYAQRMNAQGDLLWGNEGVAICTADRSQYSPKLICDNNGGAIICWYDEREQYNLNIYAQRVNASGTVLWEANGVPVCTASGVQNVQQIASDGAGGAIICWTDARYGNVNADVYAQKLDANGNSMWSNNGVIVCSASYYQSSPQLIADGTGGAIVTWGDFRGEFTDIYVQRISTAGVAQWTTDGVCICWSPYHQDAPKIVSDGGTGAIVSWIDNRNNNLDIYAQKIDNNGNTLWAQNGVEVCTAPLVQTSLQMIPDGAGGAYLTWEDRRWYSDIYAQRVNSSGLSVWGYNGIPVCLTSPVQKDPALCVTSSGNVVITWQDDYNDIYAQTLSPDGNAFWLWGGIIVCNAASFQLKPQQVASNDGNVIVSWEDNRNGKSDIYASMISADGLLLKTKFTEAENKFRIFPNPVSNVLQILSPQHVSVQNMEITDLSGKIILQQEQFTTKLNVEHLKPGVYLLKITSETATETLRFLKN